MGRAKKVDQDMVNTACDQINEAGDNVTISAVIKKVGGSYSTTGKMVKQWKEEKKKSESINTVEMPDSINTAMKKATYEIWQATSALAGEKVELARKESVIVVNEAKAELKESMQEIVRLEAELKQAKVDLKQLPILKDQCSDFKAEIKILEARLQDRDHEVIRLQDANSKLQSELIGLVKKGGK